MVASPQYHTSRGDLPNRTREISSVADAIGFPLLPWVRRALDVSTEFDPDSGLPHRRRVLWTVPRQSGKSVGVAAYTIERCLREPGAYGVYVAQSREAGRKRLRGMAEMLLRSGLDVGARFLRGIGSEALRFSNGSLVELMAPTESSGHGDSLDFAILDEVWAILPTVLWGGILPAMQARPGAQVLMISTAGTLESELLNDLRARGREDPDGRMAFVEYSKPDGLHAYDEEGWELWHPGIPSPISIELLREASEENPLPEFLRSDCNITTAVAAQVWEQESWENAGSSMSPPEELVLAVDRSEFGSAIAAAFRVGEDGWHAILSDYRSGADIDWIPTRVGELLERFDVQGIALDGSGPAAGIAPELQDLAERARVPFRPMSRGDRAKADGFLFEQLRSGRFTHGRSPVLDESQQGTPARKIGDVWIFDRGKAQLDPAPIISLSMAVYLAYETEILDPKPGIFFG